MRKWRISNWPLALMSCPQIRNFNDADHHARPHPTESDIIQLFILMRICVFTGLLFLNYYVLWLYKHNILLRRSALKVGEGGKVRLPSNLWRFSLFNLLPNSYTGRNRSTVQIISYLACKYSTFCFLCDWL